MCQRRKRGDDWNCFLLKWKDVLRICSPVVALGGAVIIKLASTNSGGAVPAVVPPENEIRGLVGEHLAVCQGLFEKNRRGEGGCSSRRER